MFHCFIYYSLLLMAKSTSNVESLSGSEELEKFYKLIIEASQKVQEMKLNEAGSKCLYTLILTYFLH